MSARGTSTRGQPCAGNGCANRLAWGNKTGLCRACLNADPGYHARKAEAIRQVFRYHPELREKQRRAVAESNRRPERRAQSGQQASERRIWEKALPLVTAEVRARQGQTNSQRRLADIPLAHRDEYQRLVKKLGAREARRIIKEHARAVAERMVR